MYETISLKKKASLVQLLILIKRSSLNGADPRTDTKTHVLLRFKIKVTF